MTTVFPKHLGDRIFNIVKSFNGGRKKRRLVDKLHRNNNALSTSVNISVQLSCGKKVTCIFFILEKHDTTYSIQTTNSEKLIVHIGKETTEKELYDILIGYFKKIQGGFRKEELIRTICKEYQIPYKIPSHEEDIRGTDIIMWPEDKPLPLQIKSKASEALVHVKNHPDIPVLCISRESYIKLQKNDDYHRTTFRHHLIDKMRGVRERYTKGEQSIFATM